MADNIEFQQEYKFEPDAGVLIRKNISDFRYSDGDGVENGIGAILKGVRDKSVLSEELASLQTDWPTTYYFSGNRANLLRPLEKRLASSRVLELGCGMGAVTRYIGETAKEVVAVEGSLRRGSVAALRCQDLPNVSIVIDEIKSLPESLGKFDVVTLVGVLEYACRYGGPGAEREVLAKARSFLKSDGILVLAIENKLGLKYLGGVPEDHLGKRWIGVTNGYREDGVKTWSRKELLALLKEEGFAWCEQFIPLPDYKLPTTIITPAGLAEEDLDLSPILDNNRRPYEHRPFINMGEAWDSVLAAGLLPDLADSLCFVAGLEGSSSPFEPGELVHHYGNARGLKKKYAKQIVIEKDDSKLCVRRKHLAKQEEPREEAYYQNLANEPYHKGQLLYLKIRKIVMRPDWELRELFQAFEPWAKPLIKSADSEWKCPGQLMDFAPFNIVMDGDRVRPFDQEWVSRKKLPLGYLLYRGFYNTMFRIMPLRKSNRHDTGTVNELFAEFARYLGLPESVPLSPDYLWWQEIKFLRQIFTRTQITAPRDQPIVYM